MSITAALVEANGWVLRLTVTASPGSFASYTMSPDTAPRVTLASSHAGFARPAGAAVPGSLARALVATKPLRKPVQWNGSGLDPVVVDETALGNGSITVRVALSEHIYASDTGLSLTVLAGWRDGESGATGIAVTNASTIAAPIPIMRWVRPQYDVVTGVFRLSLLVASHHPIGFDPVAAVRFTVTDGTTTRSAWAPGQGTDDDYGDGLRCHTVTIDPATATALTAGLLRCDAEVYPWLGAMRSTDPAGTRSMVALTTAGMGQGAELPFVVGYDPAGTRYNGRYIYVDPASTAGAAAIVVQQSLAAAQAAPMTARAARIADAIQAIYNANATLPAANGQPAQARSGNGVTIVLAPGVHVPPIYSITLGVQTGEIPIRIIGDPADPDPRNNCIVRTGTANGSRFSNITKCSWATLTLEIGQYYICNTAQANWWLDNVEVRGKAGQTGSNAAPMNGIFAFATRSRFTRTAWFHNFAVLFRNCGASRRIAAPCIVKHRFISAEEDGVLSSSAVFDAIVGTAQNTAAIEQVEDNIIAFSDFRWLRGRALNGNPTATAAAAGTPNKSLRRMLWLNNVFEKTGPTTDAPFYAIGEEDSLTMSYNIVEGNSLVGDRTNGFYSDPFPTTVAETDTLLNQAFVNRFANNYVSWQPTKHDAFYDTTTATLRGNGNGYRPHMVEAWSYVYGVGHEGNCEGGADRSFPLEYHGLRSKRGIHSSNWFVDDRSAYGPGGGGGDYAPAPGSPLLGLVLNGNSDRDFANAPRMAGGATGAFQGAALAAAVLVPASSRHGTRAAAAALAWAGGIAPVSARHIGPVLASLIGWSGQLLPDVGASLFSSSPAAITAADGASLTPSSNRIEFGDFPAALLVPSGIPGTIRTLRVGADQRTIVVHFN